METDFRAVAAILGMALVTYGTRTAGLFLILRAPGGERLERWLEAVPGCVLVSLVAPTVLASGPAEALAGLAALATAFRSKNVLLAMIVGVAAVWVLRRMF